MKIRILKSRFLVGVLSLGVIFSMCVPSVVCASDYDVLLFKAAQQGDLGEVKRLVKAGADVNWKDEKDSTPYHMKDSTPLHMAVAEGHFEVVKFLVEHGASVNCINLGNKTPLHVAANGRNVEIVKYLAEHGADVNYVNKCTSPPLSCVKNKDCSLAVVRCLVEQGADVNYVSWHGYSCLLEAIWGGNVAVIEYLLDHGADVNCDFKHGAALLRHAKDNRYGEEEICRLLKSHGAKDPNDSCVIM